MYSEEFCREPGSGLLVWEGPQECGGGWWKWTFLGYLCCKGPGSGVPAPGPVQAGGWGLAFSRDKSPPWWALLAQTRVQGVSWYCVTLPRGLALASWPVKGASDPVASWDGEGAGR